ncbi:uncharacterized protein EV420DRAFT_972818 [Desarmillaria tabescens]|uniref:Uncharacterized protein n=1 Tax=Armillaria tabescens TaxID=1929756 RepID=A0AA39JNZ0_ARMTA|nr:uncharacterized protein EV420DRAFT_972818 [Desarmillaria tabescens]KAK0445335.1 hypothetical protein EV420DRAFT_972818 [Desarmillaria tabescens]
MTSPSTPRRRPQLVQITPLVRPPRRPSLPHEPILVRLDGSEPGLQPGFELQLAIYGTEQANTHPQQISFEVNTHAIPGDPYETPCLHSGFAVGNFNITTIPTNITCYSALCERDTSGFVLHPFDRPMWELKRVRIPFKSSVPCPRGVGVNMTEILRGNHTCLKTPGEYIRDMVGVRFIDVVFHANGYLPQYIRTPLKCCHQSTGGRYFDVAFNVALGYQKILMREAPNISSSRTNADFPVVRNVEHLNLISLYSADSSAQIWWAEVALCCPESFAV